MMNTKTAQMSRVGVVTAIFLLMACEGQGGMSGGGGTGPSGGAAGQTTGRGGATSGNPGAGGSSAAGTGQTGGSDATGTGGAMSGRGGETAGTGGASSGSGGSPTGAGGAAGAVGGRGGSTGSGGNVARGGTTGSGGRGGNAGIGGSSVGRGGSGGATGTAGAKGGSSGSAGTTGTGGGSGGAKPTAGCGIASFPASGTYTIDVSGTARSYIIKLPTGFDNTKPYRLIMAWHGLGMTADQTANGSFPRNEGHYYELAPISGGQAIFTSGQGLGASGQTGWPNTNDQDVAFARAMVTYLSKTYCIDSSRIFSVGKSYGGNFTNILGCEMGDVFRAIAPQSSWLGGTHGSCVGQPAVWIAHGRSDPTIGFSRGEAARDQWLKTNHCGTTTTPWDAADTQNNCVAYDGCDADKPVIWCAFDGVHEIKDWGPPAVWKFLMQF